MGKQNYNLLIFQRTAAVPQDLPEFMLAKGFGAQVVTELPYVPFTVHQLRGPILLLELGPDEQTKEETIEYLLAKPEILSVPSIFFGAVPTQYQKVLERSFPVRAFLPVTAGSREIFAQVEKITKRYGQSYERAQQARPGVLQTRRPLVWRTEIREVVEDFTQFPEYLFNQLYRLQILDSPVGGEGLHQTFALETLQDFGLVPQEERIRNAVLDLFSNLKPSGREHLSRTAYSANALNAAIQLPAEFRAVSLSASLLHAMAMSGAAAVLLDRMYVPGESEAARVVSSKIRSSAQMIQVGLKDERVAATVLQMAEMIGERKLPPDNVEHALVSTLVAADIANRMCFQSSAWNPRGVHLLMRKIKAGELSMLHPVVLSCLVKFLNEAVMAVQDRREPGPAKRRVFRSGGLVEELIPLLELKPGMLLAQPIHAKDGRIVADKDLRLDPDLIWRIWQLAAIRVLENPYIVSRRD